MARKKKQKQAYDPSDPSTMSRRQQIMATYSMTKQTDPRIGLWLLGSFLLAGLVGFAIFWLLPGDGTISTVFAVIGGILLGILGALLVFGRRAQAAAYARMEGQTGAGASALTMLRKGWKTDPMVAFNRQQDVVHRVVGPPGIVLVGEGNPTRLRGMLTEERRKHERVAAGTPVHELQCGDAEGQVPLPQLVKKVRKLGRQVKPAEITDVLHRLKALDARRSAVPMPKGPVPQNMKGMRGNMRGR